ncbi:DUF2336 domain-containing protein [Maritalea porphyrae]|uniref:DUF2336 domain-containing protein n=1 Tax=Maritalea porphyrae TaxID=880732 RepID=UPI0022AFEC6A|nr:DUF2336 domain-containing protein [Maritalea porphyrae]MCZ4272796.1 DUF2336 domain-containing protein [Maritalea porphyrae]
MLGFNEYHTLSQSAHSEQRGQAARIAARAFLEHSGPADEQAALYAAVLSFLDDSSVKVRAALAYELLRSPNAPRPVMFALAQDESIIAAAVVQFSPVLLDSDLVALSRKGSKKIAEAILSRPQVGVNVCKVLAQEHSKSIDRVLLDRHDLVLPSDLLIELADRWCDDAPMRGTLLQRPDLPIAARFLLTERIADALLGARIVNGSIQPQRLNRLVRDQLDKATTGLVEGEPTAEHYSYLDALFQSDRLTPRLLINSVVNGRLQFFVTALAVLADLPTRKTEGILRSGTRRALHALYTRCGFEPSLRNLMARLTVLAREAHLETDVAARHFVVSQLISALIDDHEGDIPDSLDSVFAYLNEQNVSLAREAARGVMASFCEEASPDAAINISHLRDEQLALPAA